MSFSEGESIDPVSLKNSELEINLLLAHHRIGVLEGIMETLAKSFDIASRRSFRAERALERLILAVEAMPANEEIRAALQHGRESLLFYDRESFDNDFAPSPEVSNGKTTSFQRG